MQYQHDDNHHGSDLMLNSNYNTNKILDSMFKTLQKSALATLILMMILLSISSMLKYDSRTKKLGFGFCIWAIWMILAYRINYQYQYQYQYRQQNNGKFGLFLCAKTAYLLMTVVIIQIIMIGATMYIINTTNKIRNRSNNKLKDKDRVNNKTKSSSQYQYQYQYQYQQQRNQAQIFAIILLQLLVSSLIGFACSIWLGYYKQLLQKEAIEMAAYVGLGFGVVAVGDYCYIKIKEKYKYKIRSNRQSNNTNNIKLKYKQKQDSVRRKIFHFVPVALLPLLSRINFRLFTLMAFGAFYLFWLAQLIRYFGKLARNNNSNINNLQKKQLNQYLKSQRKYNLKKLVNIVQKYNNKLSQNSFIKWMQQLNSTRQPYFWFTHLSLILGLTLSYIYFIEFCNPSKFSINTDTNYNNNMNESMVYNFNPMDISIVLVLADAAAAIIGKNYGKIRIPYTGGKSVQGYLAFVFTMVIIQLSYIFIFNIINTQTQSLLSQFSLISRIKQLIRNINLSFMLISAIFCGIAQLFAGDLDNIGTGFVYIAVFWVWTQFHSQV